MKKKQCTLFISALLISSCTSTRLEEFSFRGLDQLVVTLNESVRRNDSGAYVRCFDVSASLSPLLGDSEARSYKYQEIGRRLEEKLEKDFTEGYFLDVNNRREAGTFHVSKKAGDAYATVIYKVSLQLNGAELTLIKAHLTNTGWYLLLDQEWCKNAIASIHEDDKL